MAVITVDDQGHSFYYEDTGTPTDTSGIYTTLMIVHGTGFHSRKFSPPSIVTSPSKADTLLYFFSRNIQATRPAGSQT